ncbi:unnamed protein product [Heterobilharzia americana]|nr:unnamed protein product [Heterobilharzia americana]
MVYLVLHNHRRIEHLEATQSLIVYLFVDGVVAVVIVFQVEYQHQVNNSCMNNGCIHDSSMMD